MRSLIVMCLLLTISYLPASVQPCPGRFGFSVEWLLMFSSYSQPYFTTEENIDPVNVFFPQKIVGPRIANNQNWHSGYRVEGIYSLRNALNSARIRWTHFPTFSDEKVIYGSNQQTAFSSSGGNVKLSFRDRFDFYLLDVIFDQKLVCSPIFQFAFQGGMQFGNLKLWEELDTGDLRLTNSRGPTSFHNFSQLWGIGPEIGSEFFYRLTPAFTFTGRGNVALLISQQNSSVRQHFFTTFPNLDLDINNKPYWTKVTTLDLRFGLSHTLPLSFKSGSLQMNCELGYEIMSCLKGLMRTFFISGTSFPSLSFDELMDFTLHGPYFHVGCSY